MCPTQPSMNATDYYVSACRLVVQANPDNQETWQDLYRVLPMLRNSLSCTVCERILVEPYTPEETSCQHHVCKSCRGGTKVLRCSWCKDFSKYSENVQLRILITSYRKLCALIKVTRIHQLFRSNKENGQHMIDIIRESEIHKPPVTKSRNSYSKNFVIKQEIISAEEEAELVINHSTIGDDDSDLSDTIKRTNSISDHSDSSQRTTSISDIIKRRVSSSETRANSSDHAYDSASPQLDSSALLQVDATALHRVDATAFHRDATVLRRLEPGEIQPDDEDSIIRTDPDEIMSSSSSKVLRRASPDRTSLQKVECFEFDDDDPSLERSPDIEVDPANCFKQELDPTNFLKQEEYFPTPSNTPVHSRSESWSPPASLDHGVLPKSFSSKPTVIPSPASRTARLPPTSRPTTLSSRPATFSTKQSFILKHRTDKGFVVGNQAVSASQVVQATTGSRSSVGNIVAATPFILPRNSSEQSELKAKEDPLKNKKTGCRCGNATAAPGKLTCCGQRCPCYVSRLSCIDCKCRGCNNPNLPGGGKVLPYLSVALNPESHGLVKPRSWGATTYPTSAMRISQAAAGSYVTSATATASNVVRVPAANSADSSSMTDVDINTIPVVNLSSASAYRTLIGPSPVVKRLNPSSSSINSTILSTLSATSRQGTKVHVVPSSSSTIRFISASSLATSTVRVVPASSLSTVTIPLSSLSSGGLKLRPVDQLQRREIKARVIPTTFRLKTSPYTRIPVNGKVTGTGGPKLQTVSLMSLLKSSQNKAQNIKVVKKEDVESETPVNI